MNSIIARLFIFLTEVLSIVIIAVNCLAGLVLMVTSGFWWGFGYLFVSTVVLVALFGIAAIFIESHKAIVQLRDHFIRGGGTNAPPQS